MLLIASTIDKGRVLTSVCIAVQPSNLKFKKPHHWFESDVTLEILCTSQAPAAGCAHANYDVKHAAFATFWTLSVVLVMSS